MLMLAHLAKKVVLLDFVVHAANRTGSKVLAQCAKTADFLTKVSCERGLAFRGEYRQHAGSAENGNYFGTLELLAFPVWRFPKPAHAEARKARKPSPQIMCPQQQRRMLNSLLLTIYNPVIDQFFMPLAHRPSAYEDLRSELCLLGKFDILSPDEIDRLAEKLVTLYKTT